MLSVFETVAGENKVYELEKKQCEELFYNFDEDGDGYLNTEEIKELIAELFDLIIRATNILYDKMLNRQLVPMFREMKSRSTEKRSHVGSSSSSSSSSSSIIHSNSNSSGGGGSSDLDMHHRHLKVHKSVDKFKGDMVDMYKTQGPNRPGQREKNLKICYQVFMNMCDLNRDNQISLSEFVAKWNEFALEPFTIIERCKTAQMHAFSPDEGNNAYNKDVGGIPDCVCM